MKKASSIGPAYAPVEGERSDPNGHPTGPAVASVAGDRGDNARNSSWPKPEEGLRLMHAFLSIKQAEVRETIIRYVVEQSEHQEGG
jgi:hypothetical protein